MKLLTKLEKSISFWFLLLISFFFFLLRWPSLFEPYWYGDEGVYQAVGILLDNGRSLYSQAWENKPPLLLALYAILGSDQFIIRVVSLLFGIVSIWFFYMIAKYLFPKSRNAVMIATFTYVIIFGTNLIEGNIANAENFMILPILISAYLFISGDFIKKIWQSKAYFLAGLILSLAFLTKVVAIFDFLAFSSFLFLDQNKSLKEKINKKMLPFILGFTLPVFTTIIYFLVNNNFKEFMNAFVIRNIGYVGYENQLLFPQGLLILKTAFLIVFLFFLYLQRKNISRNVLFILIWLGFSLFNTYFSQRPFTHYLIVLLPSFCLMIGNLIAGKKGKLLTLLSLVFVIIIIRQTFILRIGNIIPYYSNLISFCLDKKTVNDYQLFFDKRTPRDYLVANFIKITTEKKDKVLIWGNNAQVYKLSNRVPIFRYTVAYHTLNFPNGILEMKKAIETEKPKYIILMPDVPAFPLSLANYSQKANIDNAIIYEKIF